MAKKAEKQVDRLSELKTAIKAKDPANFYVFYGEEMFLLHHYLQQLKAVVLDPVTESFNFHRFTQENFDLRTFADAVENMPMMADRTLVQVDDVDVFKMPEDAREAMTSILSDIPPYCTVIFVYETVPFKPDKRFSKLYASFSAGQVVEFAKQNERDLMAWIQRHFLALGKRIEPKLCQYLLEITDGTMTTLGAEIRKIASYSGADTICKADIDAVTEPVLDAVVFRMTDQLSAGEFGAAIITLRKLMKMQEEPLQVLGAIGGHFRRISAAKTLQEHGKSAQELQKLCGIADYPARKAMESARRCSQEYLQKAAQLVLETDQKMKTSFDDPHRLLELLILQLSMEGRRG